MLPDPTIGEDAIIERARAGSMPALGALYETYADRVYVVALRFMRSRADAEDVLQDVFVGLPRALQRYTPRDAFWAWLRTVVVRVCLMKLRAQRRTDIAPIEEIEQRPCVTSDPHDVVAVQRALAQLPEPMRLVFLLKEVEGYSHAEVAEMLDITVAASTLRLFRAWRQLRALLRTE